MTSKKATLQLSEIDLDLKNPRINPASSQIEALAELIRMESIGAKTGEKIYNLAKSICDMGGVDPGDRLYVIEDSQNKGRYVALDGNRRLAALRLLTNASLVGNEAVGIPKSMRSRLVALRESAGESIPTHLDVIVFADRATAEPYVRLRHNGEQDGAGRSQWEAFQNARSLNNGSYQVIQQLRTTGQLDLHTIKSIDAGDFQISTFERFAVGKSFSEVFEGSITSTGFHPGKEAALSMAAWAAIANQTSAETISSRSHQTSESIRPFLVALRDKLAPLHSSIKGAPEIENSDSSENGAWSDTNSESYYGDEPSQGFTQGVAEPGGNGQPNDKVQKPPTSNNPATPIRRASPYLVKGKEKFRTDDEKCREILDELCTVRVKDAPYACALLMRSLMELTAQRYGMHFGLGLTGNKTERIHKMGAHLTSNKQSEDEPANTVDIARALLKEEGKYDDLSEISHNVYARVGEEGVRKTWASIREAIELAWRRINGSPAVTTQRQKGKG